MCEHARGVHDPSALPGSEAVVFGAVPRFHYPAFTTLRQAFGEMQRAIDVDAERTPEYIDKVKQLLSTMQFRDSEWQEFTNWNESKYTRSLVAHDPNFTVLVLCWNKGQRSPIHDHAGSCCWVKVLSGVLRERRFRHHDDLVSQGAAVDASPPGRGDKGLVCTSDASFGRGAVCYMDDTCGYHDMGVADSESRVVSMHVYSPPYYYCNALALDGTKRQVSMIAATAPQRTSYPTNCDARCALHTRHHPHLQPPAQQSERADGAVADDAKTAAVESLAAAGDAASSAPTMTQSIRQLCDKLDNPDVPKADLVTAFENTYMSPEDWNYLAHFSEKRFQRLLLHETSHWSLLMLCWLPGQTTPVHDHEGSESWVKVLTGELTLTTYESDRETKRDSVVLTDLSTAVPFHEGPELPLHTVGNSGATYAVSLHLYNPPYTDMHYNDGAHDACVAPLTPHSANAGGGVSPVQASPWDSSVSPQSANQSLGSSSLGSVSSAKVSVIPAVSCHRPCKMSHLENLMSRIDKIVNCKCECCKTNDRSELITEELSKFHVCAKEIDRFWQQRRSYGTTIRLAETPSYNIILNLWEPGITSVVHDHDGSSAFIVVVAGSIVDTTYLPPSDAHAPKVYRTSRLCVGQVCHLQPDALHSLRNPSDKRYAASLHIYQRVCRAATWFSLRVAAKPMRVSADMASTCDGVAYSCGSSTPAAELNFGDGI